MKTSIIGTLSDSLSPIDTILATIELQKVNIAIIKTYLDNKPVSSPVYKSGLDLYAAALKVQDQNLSALFHEALKPHIDSIETLTAENVIQANLDSHKDINEAIAKKDTCQPRDKPTACYARSSNRFTGFNAK
jgi:hypothetical protein